MSSVLKIYWRSDGASPLITLLCLLAASLAEGIGFASLLPLLAIAGGDQGEDTSPVFIAVRDAFQSIGLSLEVGPILLIVVTAIVLKSALTLLAMFYVGRAVAEITTRLRRRFMALVIDVRWDYYVRQSGGKLTNALMGLSLNSGRAYEAAARFVASTVQTVILVTIALVVSFKVTLAGCAIGLLIAVFLHYFVSRSRRTGKKETVRQREIGVAWNNAMAAMKPLKAMHRHAEYFQRFDKLLLDWRRSAVRQVLLREGRTNVQEGLYAIVLGIGAYLALVVWTVPVVEIIVVGVILVRAVRSLGKLQQQYQTAVALEYPYIEIDEVLTEIAQARENRSGTAPSPAFEDGLRFENLSYAHGDVAILNRVDLDVPGRGVTVLTGPSGAGKTTTADLILGLYQPQQGRVVIDGTPLPEIDLAAWRRAIGYVPQDSVVFHATIFENIQLYDSNISKEDVVRALELARAWDFVQAMPDGLDTLLGDRGETISGGQRQRLALARALVVRPKLMILDEVTSALDPENEQLIVEALRDLAQEVAILAITHRPAILEVATRIYEVRDRTIIPVDLSHFSDDRSLGLETSEAVGAR
ncbi:MAG: ABC transporter ATP-binding protein [Pseudomonadota bacterium]